MQIILLGWGIFWGFWDRILGVVWGTNTALNSAKNLRLNKRNAIRLPNSRTRKRGQTNKYLSSLKRVFHEARMRETGQPGWEPQWKAESTGSVRKWDRHGLWLRSVIHLITHTEKIKPPMKAKQRPVLREVQRKTPEPWWKWRLVQLKGTFGNRSERFNLAWRTEKASGSRWCHYWLPVTLTSPCLSIIPQ